MARYQAWLTEDGLKVIESWARDGLTDKQIAMNIGIAERTFTSWKDKYNAINTVLKKGKRPVDFEVENKLLQRAMGYDYEETETVIEEYNGKKKTKIRKIKKHAPPDTAAAIFWLKNRKPEEWRRINKAFADKTEAETEKLLAETARLKRELETNESTEDKLSDILDTLGEAIDNS